MILHAIYTGIVYFLFFTLFFLHSAFLCRYVLNREPEEFEHIRFLVDGSHYQGMKKLKKKDTRAGKKGPLGCNSAYNFNLYKEFTKTSADGAKNSQGREFAIFRPRMVIWKSVPANFFGPPQLNRGR